MTLNLLLNKSETQAEKYIDYIEIDFDKSYIILSKILNNRLEIPLDEALELTLKAGFDLKPFMDFREQFEPEIIMFCYRQSHKDTLESLVAKALKQMKSSLNLDKIKTQIGLYQIEAVDQRYYSPISSRTLLSEELDTIFGNLKDPILNGIIKLPDVTINLYRNALMKMSENLIENDQNATYFYIIDFALKMLESAIISDSDVATSNKLSLEEFYNKLERVVPYNKPKRVAYRKFRDKSSSIHTRGRF
jgi:hypothetical protein